MLKILLQQRSLQPAQKVRSSGGKTGKNFQWKSRDSSRRCLIFWSLFDLKFSVLFIYRRVVLLPETVQLIAFFFFKTHGWEEICFLNWHFKNVKEHYCFFLRPYADDTMKLLCFPCTQLLRELFPLLSFQNLGFIRIFFVLLYADYNRCFCVFLLLYIHSECPKNWFYFIYISYVILMPCASGWFILSFIYFSTFSHCFFKS